MTHPSALLLLIMCGGYRPEPMPEVSRVFHDPFSGRAFILLDDAVKDPDSIDWTTIAPPDAPLMYLLPADIADAPDLRRVRSFTLLGDKGPVVVKTRARVYLRDTPLALGAVVALEIDPDDAGDAWMALDGVHADATWTPASWEGSASTTADDWLVDHGWQIHDSWDGRPAPVFAGHVPGTDVELFNAWLADTDREQTLIVRDGVALSWQAGWIDGAISLGDREALVVSTAAGFATIRL